MKLSEEILRGRTVIAADGLSIGQVASIYVDTDTWRVEELQVKLHKDVAERIGVERSMFHASAIDVPTAVIQSVGDAVVLSVRVDDLRYALPGEGESAAPH